VLNPEKVGISLPVEESKKYLLSTSDVLFARTGNTVGKVYLHREQAEKCVYAGYLVRFRLNTKKILPDYLFLFTRSQFYKKWIENTVRVGAQPNINGQEYSTLPVLVPPIELQEHVLSQAGSIETAKKEAFRNIYNIRKVITCLMSGATILEEAHV